MCGFKPLVLGLTQAGSQNLWWGEGKQHPSLNIEISICK